MDVFDIISTLLDDLVDDTLQHIALHCNILQHTARHCNAFHCNASHCTTLHQTASHCNTLQQMDLFEIRSTMMDNFVDDLKNTKVNLEDYQRELEVMTLQGMYSVERDLFSIKRHL